MSVKVTRPIRLIFGLVFVLALGNWIYLYFLPDQAATNYAWSINPPVSAAALSVGYGAAVAISYYLLTLKDARQLKIILLPAALFSAMEAVATLLHTDKFFWNYPPTWVWIGIYLIIPFVLAGIYFYYVRNERKLAGNVPPKQPMSVALRLVYLVGGAGLLLFAAAMFLAPDVITSIWAWKLTPLVCRAVAAWVALLGLGSLTAALYNDWYQSHIIISSSFVYFFLMFLLVPRFADSFDWSKPASWGFVAVTIGGCLVAIYSYLERRNLLERAKSRTHATI